MSRDSARSLSLYPDHAILTHPQPARPTLCSFRSLLPRNSSLTSPPHTDPTMSWMWTPSARRQSPLEAVLPSRPLKGPGPSSLIHRDRLCLSKQRNEQTRQAWRWGSWLGASSGISSKRSRHCQRAQSPQAPLEQEVSLHPQAHSSSSTQALRPWPTGLAS